jgi:ArsR family transcriptional regulator
MKMMKDCGLVDSRKDGIWVKYSVNHEKLDELKDFFQTMAKQNTTV